MGNISKGSIRQDIVEYIDSTVWATLATVRSDGTPVVRTIGAFSFDKDSRSIYFATFPNAEKTKHIQSNNRVSFFFQHEGQQLHEFRNAELIGDAAKITGDAEIKRVAGHISDRSPFVKEHIEKNGIETFEFYRISATEIKFLDYSKGIGPQAVETFNV